MCHCGAENLLSQARLDRDKDLPVSRIGLQSNDEAGWDRDNGVVVVNSGSMEKGCTRIDGWLVGCLLE